METDRNILKTDLSIPRQAFIQPGWFSRAAKRLADILASLLGLLVLSPAFAFVAIMIKRDSPGPVFYRGLRTGKNGRPFSILKFRSMYERPESYDGPRVTAQGDKRITPLGGWLRDTKLNELPQLWNVLVGDMSLVGPRPEDPDISSTWPVGLRREILSVRPGITSPASIAHHDEEKQLDATGVMDDYFERLLPDKLRLDQLYVRHHSFITDLDALFWTFVILIPRLRDFKISEGWLFGGPISRFARRYASWTATDFLTAFLSIGLVGVLWRLGGPLDIGIWNALGSAVVLAFLFGFFNTLLGLGTVEWSHAAAEDAFRLLVSCGLVTLAVIGFQFLFLTKPFLPVRFMFIAGLLVLVSFMAVRYRLRLVTGIASRWINLRHSGYGAGERVLVVGAGEGSEFVAWLLRRTDFRRLYTIIGIVDDDPSKQGMQFDGLKVLGTTADIPGIVQRQDIGVLFYTISRISPADSQRILDTCRKTKIHLVMISDVLRTLHTRLTKVLPRCEKVCPYLIGSDSFSEPANRELETENMNA